MSGGRLELSAIAKRWRSGQDALANVSLVVEAGTTLAVLGRSGAGKSTLLRVIAGLERADAGRVTLGECVLADDHTHVPPESRGVGMVFQALELWPHLTVAEHVAFGLPGRPRGARALAAARDLVRAVGLDEALLTRRPDTLSGGEQQRVAIARALAPRPQVLLYDEPLAHLDPERRVALRRLIRRLARAEGTTLVYVTHDPEEALELGDTLAVFEAGHVVEFGAPAQIYGAPRTIAGARSLGPISVVPGRVQGGVATTVLGSAPAREGLSDGPCVVLYRPERIRVVDSGDIQGRVEDCVVRGGGASMELDVDGVRVQALSAAPCALGSRVAIEVGTAVAVLPAAAAAEVAA
ncbi:MAG: ABC transporter ATP-binding protein [Planctomycetota bacterium]|nr:ABC transporter ATP-binding protein [Planctomycetota bacterium]